MGKFNSTDGINFTRSTNQIINDYAKFLLDKKIISDEELLYYVNDGQGELLDGLIEQLYETEKYHTVTVSTLNSFYIFCTIVLKEYHNQRVWNSFVKNMFLAIERNKDTAIMASRSIGKSFFNFVLYPLFKMFLYKGTKFLHISNIPTQCVENLRITKEVIDSNEFLFQKKGAWKGKELKWTERQIEYNDGMLITLSAGTSPKGLHVHYAAVDDILTEGAQLNDEEMATYIFGQVYPTIQRAKGRLIVTGTPLHRKDIYHLLMGDKPNFEGDPISDGQVSYKKFFSMMFPIADEDDKSLFPDIYTDSDVEYIREKVGEIAFQREYMLNCIDEHLSLFSNHLLDSISDGQLKYYYSPDNPNEQFIIGADVATSGEASADFSAFAIIGFHDTDAGRKKVIRHIIQEKGMPISVQITTLAELSNRFNNAVVIIEKNNVGVALIQELVKMNINVEEYITTKEKKEGMVRYLVNEMKNKNIWFPEETNEITRMKKELVNFGVKRNKAGKERMEALTGHDDLVMALAMANQAAQDVGGIGDVILMKR